jgi:hypothetical protein
VRPGVRWPGRPGAVGDPSDQQAGEGQHADDQRNRQISRSQGHRGHDGEGGGDRPEPADGQPGGDEHGGGAQQPRVLGEPELEGAAAQAVEVKGAAARGPLGQLEADGFGQAHMPRPCKEFATQGRVQQIGDADQDEQRAPQDDAVAASPPVTDLPELPDHRRHQQQAGLLDQHGPTQAQPGGGVGGQTVGGRQGQQEGGQYQRSGDVVQVDGPVHAQGERGKAEGQHGPGGRGPPQPEPASHPVQQLGAEQLHDQHELPAGSDRGRGPVERASEGRPAGQQQPPERGVVVPVGVVAKGVPVLHGPGLGHVGPLVVDPLGRPTHAGGMDDGHHQQAQQQHNAGPVPP